MKLTKTDRDAFVRAVMNDVPIIDHRDLAAKAVSDYDYSQMDPLVKKVQDSPVLRGYLKRENMWIGGWYLPSVTDFAIPEWLKTEVEAIKIAADIQDSDSAKLIAEVSAMIAGCNTLKAAKERLPEFEKYLPAERGETGTTNLLTINVIADLTKMGWPKDLQKAA